MDIYKTPGIYEIILSSPMGFKVKLIPQTKYNDNIRNMNRRDIDGGSSALKLANTNNVENLVTFECEDCSDIAVRILTFLQPEYKLKTTPDDVKIQQKYIGGDNGRLFVSKKNGITNLCHLNEGFYPITDWKCHGILCDDSTSELYITKSSQSVLLNVNIFATTLSNNTIRYVWK